MNELEDQLRDTLRYRATLPRLGDDVAGAAIQTARTRQRRRLAVAAGVVLLVAAVAAVSFAGGPSAAPRPANTGTPTVAPSPTPSPTGNADKRHGVNLDVLEGTDLYTLEGRHLQLPITADYILRVPAGWLYGSWNKPAGLFRDDGTAVALPKMTVTLAGGEQPGRPVVSADGRSVSWVSGTTMYAATIGASGLVGMVTTTVPSNSFAVSWIGARVVVGHTYETGCCGYDHAEYDVWDPARGDFVPQWTRGINPIFGPVPDGVPAFVRVDQGSSGIQDCLVRVDGVASMAPQAQRGCPPGFSAASLSDMLSPDGRYLVDRDFRTEGLVVYSLLDIDTKPLPQTQCPGGDWPLIWETAQAFLVYDQHTHQVTRCTVGSNASQAVGVQVGWIPVPRYGV